MATSELTKNLTRVHGPSTQLAYCEFTTAGTSAPTVVERHGIKSISRSGTGAFAITFDVCKYAGAILGRKSTAALLDKAVTLTALDASAGTATVTVGDLDQATVVAADTTGLTITLLLIKRVSA